MRTHSTLGPSGNNPSQSRFMFIIRVSISQARPTFLLLNWFWQNPDLTVCSVLWDHHRELAEECAVSWYIHALKSSCRPIVERKKTISTLVGPTRHVERLLSQPRYLDAGRLMRSWALTLLCVTSFLLFCGRFLCLIRATTSIATPLAWPSWKRAIVTRATAL